jgi:hypothetical protein
MNHRRAPSPTAIALVAFRQLIYTFVTAECLGGLRG